MAGSCRVQCRGWGGWLLLGPLHPHQLLLVEGCAAEAALETERCQLHRLLARCCCCCLAGQQLAAALARSSLSCRQAPCRLPDDGPWDRMTWLLCTGSCPPAEGCRSAQRTAVHPVHDKCLLLKGVRSSARPHKAECWLCSAVHHVKCCTLAGRETGVAAATASSAAS